MGSFTPRALMQLAESPSISPLAFRLFAILDNLQHARGVSTVYYPRREFAKKIGIGLHQAVGAFKELEKLGLITPSEKEGVAIGYKVASLERIVFNADGSFEIACGDVASSATTMLPVRQQPCCQNGNIDVASSATNMLPVRQHSPTLYKENLNIKKGREINARETRDEVSPPLQTQNDFRYPQTAAEVMQAAEAQGVKMTEDDALAFLANYASKGWMVNGAKITNWRARIWVFMEARKRITQQQGANNNGNEVIRGGHVVASEQDFASDPLFGKFPGA